MSVCLCVCVCVFILQLGHLSNLVRRQAGSQLFRRDICASCLEHHAKTALTTATTAGSAASAATLLASATPASCSSCCRRRRGSRCIACCRCARRHALRDAWSRRGSGVARNSAGRWRRCRWMTRGAWVGLRRLRWHVPGRGSTIVAGRAWRHGRRVAVGGHAGVGGRARGEGGPAVGPGGRVSAWRAHVGHVRCCTRHVAHGSGQGRRWAGSAGHASRASRAGAGDNGRQRRMRRLAFLG
mmetsp:Transcript_22875/g.73645  ORF Transcript_22875/g.73645 Transcript_22875/m.73645 type:complete len:241 (+) Transcript_22875:294-1016(+)